MKIQSKTESLIESITNVAVGYGVALVSQIIVFPWFGIHIRLRDNIAIGIIFTIISVLRSFCMRRLFNWFSEKYVNKLLEEGNGRQ